MLDIVTFLNVVSIENKFFTMFILNKIMNNQIGLDMHILYKVVIRKISYYGCQLSVLANHNAASMD